MNDIEKFIKATTGDATTYSGVLRPRIYCIDGDSVSIQANSGAYCTPRVSGAAHYYEVEAGFPSSVPPVTWEEYAEDWGEDGTETVYGYMPVEVAQDYLDEHGGIDWEKTGVADG